MQRRMCENCRHFVRSLGEAVGECRVRSVPGAFPQRNAREDCGEWQDARFTPAQHERRDLIRQFALAIVASDTNGNMSIGRVWQMAAEFADYEGQT